MRTVNRGDDWSWVCSVCDLEITREEREIWSKELRLGSYKDFHELISIASNFPPYTPPQKSQYEPLALLIELIGASRKFIHFMSYNIDSTFITALHIASKRTAVRGIVGRPLDSYTRALVDSLPRSDNFSIIVQDDRGTIDNNHSKIIIIDGIVMIEGSTNLSMNAFNKVSGVGRPPSEKPRVSLQPYEVMRDNNQYFSTNWLQYQTGTTASECFPLPF